MRSTVGLVVLAEQRESGTGVAEFAVTLSRAFLDEYSHALHAITVRPRLIAEWRLPHCFVRLGDPVVFVTGEPSAIINHPPDAGSGATDPQFWSREGTVGHGEHRSGSRVPFLQDALAALLVGTTELPASELTRVVNVAGKVLGAESARVLVADYALVCLQQLGENGPTGDPQSDRGHARWSCLRTR